MALTHREEFAQIILYGSSTQNDPAIGAKRLDGSSSLVGGGLQAVPFITDNEVDIGVLEIFLDLGQLFVSDNHDLEKSVISFHVE